MKKQKINAIMSELARYRWKNTPKWKRRLHIKKMNEARKIKRELISK